MRPNPRRRGNRFYAPLAGLEVDAVRLYQGGMSTREVAEFLGVGKSWVARIAAAHTRDKSTANLLRFPPKSIHPRSSREAARKLWQRVRGEIPLGHEIHHRDGDYTNNCIANLECLSKEEHDLRHAGDPTPRHLRPQRKEYMRKYLANYRKKARKARVG